MKLAVYADLPAGGAAYALSRFLTHLPTSWAVDTYVPQGSNTIVETCRRIGELPPAPLPGPLYYANRLTVLRRIAQLRRAERELAQHAEQYDTWLVHSGQDRGAPELLKHLGDRAVFYVTEPLRLYREPNPPDGAPTWLWQTARAVYAPIAAWLNANDANNGRRAPRTLANSRYTARRCAEVYGTDASVVYPSVDARFLEAPVGEGRGEYVLSPGALLPQKGHGRVIRALARLAKPPELVIAGASRGSGMQRRLQRLAQQRGVPVRVITNPPHGQLLDLMRDARVVAVGAVREPFGLVSLEGQAVGRPVVVIDEGGLAETLNPGHTGYAVAEGEFGRVLGTFFTEPGLAESLGAAGRPWVEQHFTAERAGWNLAEALSRR